MWRPPRRPVRRTEADRDRSYIRHVFAQETKYPLPPLPRKCPFFGAFGDCVLRHKRPMIIKIRDGFESQFCRP
jgi:hypothetical protein